MPELKNSVCKSFLESIDQRTTTIGVVGLGYVGLPLIDAFVKNGFGAIGFDIDPAKIASLNNGKSYIAHIEDKTIQSWRDENKFEATDQFDRLADADAILICVPTPLSESRDPDLRYVEATAHEIAKRLRPGQLIALESTTYPGTTKDVLLPILEQSGLKVGTDFFLAYSPEREDPGNAVYSAKTIPKVVGGHDPNSLEVANALYASAVSATVPVSSCEIAEACLLYTSPSPRDRQKSRMPSSA